MSKKLEELHSHLTLQQSEQNYLMLTVTAMRSYSFKKIFLLTKSLLLVLFVLMYVPGICTASTFLQGKETKITVAELTGTWQFKDNIFQSISFSEDGLYLLVFDKYIEEGAYAITEDSLTVLLFYECEIRILTARERSYETLLEGAVKETDVAFKKSPYRFSTLASKYFTRVQAERKRSYFEARMSLIMGTWRMVHLNGANQKVVTEFMMDSPKFILNKHSVYWVSYRDESKDIRSGITLTKGGFVLNGMDKSHGFNFRIISRAGDEMILEGVADKARYILKEIEGKTVGGE